MLKFSMQKHQILNAQSSKSQRLALKPTTLNAQNLNVQRRMFQRSKLTLPNLKLSNINAQFFKAIRTEFSAPKPQNFNAQLSKYQSSTTNTKGS